jgi:hypothetical protein
MVASPLLKQRLNKFAVGLDNLVLWDPLYIKNLHSYIKWAGNLHFYKGLFQLNNLIIKNEKIEDPQRLYANNCYTNFFSVYKAMFSDNIGKRNYPDNNWLS